jgi:hypothetical protein
MNKVCTKCKEEKDYDSFWFNKNKQKYHSQCKKCKYESNKIYVVPKEKKAEYDKRYREKNILVLNQRKRDEYTRNKSKYIERQIKIQNTLEGRLKHNIRTRIANCIKRKSNSSKELLGCDMDFYISYLEYFFDDQMSWENYGSYWHIDHVNPLKNFDLTNETERLIAFNWKNTRPLYKTYNLSKEKNTITELLYHNSLVEKFIIATSSN